MANKDKGTKSAKKPASKDLKQKRLDKKTKRDESSKQNRVV